MPLYQVGDSISYRDPNAYNIIQKDIIVAIPPKGLPVIHYVKNGAQPNTGWTIDTEIISGENNNE